MRSFASLTRPVNCEIMINMGDVDRSEGSSIITIPPLSSTCAQGTQMRHIPLIYDLTARNQTIDTPEKYILTHEAFKYQGLGRLHAASGAQGSQEAEAWKK